MAFSPGTMHSPETKSHRTWWGAASPILNDTPVVCIYTSYNRNHGVGSNIAQSGESTRYSSKGSIEPEKTSVAELGESASQLLVDFYMYTQRYLTWVRSECHVGGFCGGKEMLHGIGLWPMVLRRCLTEMSIHPPLVRVIYGWLVLWLAASMGWVICSTDIKSACLQGTCMQLEWNIYITPQRSWCHRRIHLEIKEMPVWPQQCRPPILWQH